MLSGARAVPASAAPLDPPQALAHLCVRAHHERSRSGSSDRRFAAPRDQGAILRKGFLKLHGLTCTPLHRLTAMFCSCVGFSASAKSCWQAIVVCSVAPTLQCTMLWHCLQELHLDGFDGSYDVAGTYEDVGKDVWVALVRVLVASCSKLQTLLIGYNCIDAAGAEALACQLSQTCHELRKLDISGNDLGDAGAGALVRHLAHGCRELRELHISENQIGAAGAEALVRHLATGCRRLQKLYMSSNPMGQAGALAVARCVATGCPELQMLVLPFIRDGGKAVDDKVLEAAVKAKLGLLKDTCALYINW